MVLTQKQRHDMHVGMLEYMKGQGGDFADAAAAFAVATGLEDATGNESFRGLLEKKWTSVVRLQRKVMDLEARLDQAQEDLKSGVRPGREKGAGGSDRVLPRAPAKGVLTGHRNPVTCVALHPLYSVVASSSEDATVKVWDYETGECERTLKGHTNVVQSVAFSPDGQRLASCAADTTVKIWNFSEGGAGGAECLKTLRGHDHNVSCVAWVPPAGDTLVSCSRDQTIKLWEAATGFCTRTLKGDSEWVRRVALSDDGEMLASCGNDHSVKVWSVHSGQCLHDLREHTHVVESVAFAPESAERTLATAVGSAGGRGGAGAVRRRFVASGSRDKTVKLWNASVGHCLMTFSVHENWVRCVLVHPSGAFVLSASDDRSVRAFDVKTGRCARKLEDAHGHFVTALAMHKTSPIVVSGGVDRELHVWECR
ncbi:unnamed protein product [Ectocarpus sp. 12 AP-2014]